MLSLGRPRSRDRTGLVPRRFLIARLGAAKSLLAPGLVERDCCGIRESEAAVARSQRQAKRPLGGMAREDLGRQSARLRAEQEGIAGRKSRREERAPRFGREGEDPGAAKAPEAGFEIRMLEDL